MLKAAIFDIDGTLVDSVDLHAEAWVRAFHRFRYQHVTFAEVRSQIGKGGDQLMPVFIPQQDLERIGDALEQWRSELFRREYMPHVKPFPMVRELFEHLKNDGWQIALASSSNKQDLEQYKKIANIGDLLEASTSADDAERSKPHPDIFAAALDHLGGLKPTEVVVVGDTPYDAEAARKLGVREIIGVLCGGFREDDLRKSGCTAIYPEPADILEHYAESAFGRARKAA
ncbi:HAD-superfamily hydrolase, subfamily IA, variant 1 [Candidatus Koribacter versatilis Ellin345]|uniref:HAD-superfamily hydrolase, subfamily IA, variant 1 n=1 Tax=Koribacter versatilis (strain Ellin345) TaxID=204669 RepID=Q1IVR2_KORVE|nr:HAD family hydrolase [Candidatus Koribacter versatilis]ABF39038.1 HAD-superfamily hydrolase, subfamily IA, variant 1 [Candidatus Koribacter versatilis Ellin345]